MKKEQSQRRSSGRSENPRIVAEIEARMASSRLPRKIMADIQGRPILGRVLDAARRIRRVDEIIVATTDHPLDDDTQAWCEAEGVACFRGSEEDVLGRVHGAVQRMKGDLVVEMTGDNPLSCPEVIDAQIELCLDGGYDYVGDNICPSYPVGCGAKLFWADMLEALANDCDDPYVREHVSLYFYEHPEIYKIGTLAAPDSIRWPELRVTVDTPDDLEFARKVFRRLHEEGVDIRYSALVRTVRAHRLHEMNQHVRQKPARYAKAAGVEGA